MFTVCTKREDFSVTGDGLIFRLTMPEPSGKWKALALVRRCNFGIVETIPFAEWSKRLGSVQWTYKNGKPRYTLRDLDHGTVREWGNYVTRVYEL